MAMSKQDFIALADAIREHNGTTAGNKFDLAQLATLAEFCEGQNRNFNRMRWLGYLAGINGPSGGKVKRAA